MYAVQRAAPGRSAISVRSEDSTAKAPKVLSFIMTGLLSPNKAQISAVVVEYGLYEGRFWLPRVQSMEGFAEAAFARVPVRYENAFTYTSVNATLGLAPILVDTTVSDDTPRLSRAPQGLDSAARRKWRDSTRAVEWYRKAVERNLAVAKHNLALLLRDGKGTPRDVKAAVELLRAAARQGMAASMFVVVPVLLLFLFAQRYFIRGVQLTGLAGR